MRTGRGRGGGGGSHRSPYSVDGLLGPRVEDYVRLHEGPEADEVVSWLRCELRCGFLLVEAHTALTRPPQRLVPGVRAQAGCVPAQGASLFLSSAAFVLLSDSYASSQSVERVLASLRRRPPPPPQQQRGSGGRRGGDGGLEALEEEHLARRRRRSGASGGDGDAMEEEQE